MPGEGTVGCLKPPRCGRAAVEPPVPLGAGTPLNEAMRKPVKINLEIDCTPDEARRFFGLPDVAPMQEAVMAKLQERMMQAVDATTPEALMRAWVPMAPELMQQGMNALFGAFMKKQADAKKD